MNHQHSLTLTVKSSRTFLLAFLPMLAIILNFQNHAVRGTTAGKLVDSRLNLQLPTASSNHNQPTYLHNLNSFFSSDLADSIEALALDDAGAIYVAGKTSSPGFPLVNPYQSLYGGGDSDGFITVFAPDGQSLLFSTYLGGNGIDIIKDIEIGNSGRIFVTGETGSSDFPTVNPFQSSLAGFKDGFVTVFEPDSPTIFFSTYFGGGDGDYPKSIAVDSNGTVNIAGYTFSTDLPLINPIQTYQGSEEVFVTGFSPNGQSLIYSTYIGGSQNERPSKILLDSNGRKYITGYTKSTDFPIANAYQPTHSGLWDGFISILSADGQLLDMSTFLGGSLSDSINTIQLDMNDRVYVGGSTDSHDFPLVNPYQPTKGAFGDGFVTIFNQDDQSLFYSSYLGGNASDSIQSIAIDDSGRAHTVGYTYSTDFPIVNSVQSNNGGAHDVFLTSFEIDGQSLFYSTYLGGDGGDIGYTLTLDENSSIYIAGITWSTNFPLLNPYQPNITGYVDGFVTILNANGQSLRYSTYLGGSYPAPNDVSLTSLTSSTTNIEDAVPTWVWLIISLSLIFFISLPLRKFIKTRTLNEQSK